MHFRIKILQQHENKALSRTKEFVHVPTVSAWNPRTISGLLPQCERPVRFGGKRFLVVIREHVFRDVQPVYFHISSLCDFASQLGLITQSDDNKPDLACLLSQKPRLYRTQNT